jgi:hypothetical protein
VAESPLTIRFTLPERRALKKLVALRQQELGHDAKVSQGSFMRNLVREAAQAKGIAVDEDPSSEAASVRPTRKANGGKR